MRVLMATGDKRFVPGHPRYDLQKSAVAQLQVVYMGQGSVWPKVPRGPFDVVSAQDPFWRGLWAWYAARTTGARFNVQLHADLVGQSALKHLLAQIVLRHADSVRVVSEKIKQQVLHIVPKAKVAVLPVFVDVSRFKSLMHQPQPHKTILWVGRFEAEKDPLWAIEIFKTIPNAKLVMLGAGSLEAQMRDEISRLNLDGRVEMPGWQDPGPYLQKADVVLCTSPYESFGESIVEALAAGVPVVAPDVGIAKEAGAIIAPRSNLGEAVRRVLQTGERGVLKLNLFSREEWAQAWRSSLGI